jgi:hypothetical protein
MNNSTDAIRILREKNISALKEDLQAAASQLEFTDDEVARKRIKRRIESLEQEILVEEEKLAGPAPPLATPAPHSFESKEEEGRGQQPSVFIPGRRWALLAGVNQYDDYSPLQVCVKDVEAISQRLIGAGYDPDHLRLLTDNEERLPTREEIITALQSWADLTGPDDLLLFYYSGHGDADGDDTYLVARNGRRKTLPLTAIKLSDVTKILRSAPARARIIILDACHSGADIRGKGAPAMSEDFIKHVFEQAEGLVVIASCKQGEKSYEWLEQERSAFTHFLLEALEGKADIDNKKFVTVQDVNRYVRYHVSLWAGRNNRSQTPTLACEVSGDIILADYRRHKP